MATAIAMFRCAASTIGPTCRSSPGNMAAADTATPRATASRSNPIRAPHRARRGRRLRLPNGDAPPPAKFSPAKGKTMAEATASAEQLRLYTERHHEPEERGVGQEGVRTGGYGGAPA